MKDEFEKVLTAIHYWNLNLKDPSESENFESRMVLQKLTYIAQILGIQTTYPFNFYIYGPYSPTLADDYYQFSHLISEQKKPPSPHEQQEKILKAIQKYVLSHSLFQHHRTEFLEALATLFYFKTVNPDNMEDELFKKTRESKPFLKDRIIIIALNVLKELLFDKRVLTPELRKEINLWERAED